MKNYIEDDPNQINNLKLIKNNDYSNISINKSRV